MATRGWLRHREPRIGIQGNRHITSNLGYDIKNETVKTVVTNFYTSRSVRILAGQCSNVLDSMSQVGRIRTL